LGFVFVPNDRPGTPLHRHVASADGGFAAAFRQFDDKSEDISRHAAREREKCSVSKTQLRTA
jgi:hypothetical protein